MFLNGTINTKLSVFKLRNQAIDYRLLNSSTINILSLFWLQSNNTGRTLVNILSKNKNVLNKCKILLLIQFRTNKVNNNERGCFTRNVFLLKKIYRDINFTIVQEFKICMI